MNFDQESKKEVKMLTVTESAKQLLKGMLQTHSDDPEASLRLSADPDGRFGIALDSEAEGDQVVEHEGAKVLLVASTLAPMLEEVTLDVQDTAEGPKLVMSKKGGDNSQNG
jgi:Fe-S cluster assembly iron-binding protein IscA